MTEPGPIEKVPLKVVPMYIEPDPGIEVAPEPEEVADKRTGRPPRAAREPREPRPPREKTILAGALALAASVVVAVLTGVAMVLAYDGVFRTATVLAWVAIVLSVVAIGAGVWAIITKRGRRLGIIAVVIGILGNPYLLLAGLSVLSGVQS